MKDDSKKYYYLVSSLPELHFGRFTIFPDIRYYFTYIHQEITPEDSAKIRYMFYPYDNRNLVNICLSKKAEWNPLGNYSKEQLLKMLNESSKELPEYLNIFYDDYLKGTLPGEEFVLQHEIADRFYEYVLPRTEGFVHEWLTFNRDFRNILVAMSARQNHYSTVNQFISESNVVTRLKTDNSYNFGHKADYPFLDDLIQLAESHQVLEMEKQVDFIRWTKIDELSQMAGFSFNAVASFIAKLIMVQRWSSLNAEKGKKVVQDKLDAVTQKLKFSKEFTL